MAILQQRTSQLTLARSTRSRVQAMMMLQVYLFFTLVASSLCMEQSVGMGMGIESAHIVMKTSCSSFFFNSQVNNAQGWKVIPEECEELVAQYMNNGQYAVDMEGVAMAALKYLKGIAPRDDGKDVVIFDIDETALSNLPYYHQHRYGAEVFDHPLFSKWVEEGEAPAIPAMLSLYTALLADNWGVVFMTGRVESQRNITSENLLAVGYEGWTTLLLRSPSEVHLSAVEYKTQKRLHLQEQGYRIWSSLGDQWSDLAGAAVGNRTFKLPNPMYYIP